MLTNTLTRRRCLSPSLLRDVLPMAGAGGELGGLELGWPAGRPQLKTHCPRSGCGCGALGGIGGLIINDAESGYGEIASVCQQR